MLYGFFLKIKSSLVWIGAGLLAVLAALGRIQYLKTSRDRAKEKAEVLEAQVRLNQRIKQVEKEVRKDLRLKEEEIKKKLKKKGKDFEGLDNLTNPNDY